MILFMLAFKSYFASFSAVQLNKDTTDIQNILLVSHTGFEMT